MILGKGFITALALCGACAAGALETSGFARAQAGQLRPDTPPAMRKLLTDPAVRPAVALMGRGDFAGSAALFRESARRGSPSAQVMLAQMYLAGKGVPQNYRAGTKLLAVVIRKHEEPAFSVAMDTLRSLQAARQPVTQDRRTAVARARDEQMKDPEVRRQVQELVQGWQQWRRAGSPTGILTCIGMVCM